MDQSVSKINMFLQVETLKTETKQFKIVIN